MLQEPSSSFPVQVGKHYDRLAPFYLRLWGNRLHHGLWEQHAPASITEATTLLLDLLATPLALSPGNRLIDIGCGYGADAHRLARQYRTLVTGLTASRSQAATAARLPPPPHGAVRVVHGDWIQNDFPARSFDAALAIESLAHMQDKPAFFTELARTLVPGGRAALSCWTSVADPGSGESLLLGYLCRTGALSSIGTLESYCRLAARAGLTVLQVRDLTTRVEPTWGHIAQRVLASSLNPLFLGRVLPLVLRRPSLPGAIPAMMLAYRTGTLRYHAIWLRKQPIES